MEMGKEGTKLRVRLTYYEILLLEEELEGLVYQDYFL